MAKTEKKEGATTQCFTCKTQLICVAVPSSGNYPAKLQWHDENGAHYGFDQKNQKPVCKSQAPKIERAERAGEASQARGEIHLKDLKLTQEEILEIQKETDEMLERQLCRIFFIEEGLKGRGIMASGPFVGMLYNQQMESLRTT